MANKNRWTTLRQYLQFGMHDSLSCTYIKQETKRMAGISLFIVLFSLYVGEVQVDIRGYTHNDNCRCCIMFPLHNLSF